ncbi:MULTISPECIES: IS3 family transposase [Providencia]|nr:IS3 family transposase [Providencia huaxiensis]MBZ3680906.1 IS3 family transposase [Providencia rettgeri]QLR01490.1 IS3 family transposase [Providencia rettgeri]QPE17756.1 IS3 family transposase [Providencia rettgeri]
MIIHTGKNSLSTIEEYCNTKWIKIKLKDLTPVEYRNQALQAI